MKMKRLATTTALLIAFSVCGALISTVASATVRTGHPASIPPSWKSYTYGKARISVPSNWVVQHNSGCPVQSAAGTLNLGSPKVPFPSCPTPFRNGNTVSLSPLTASDRYSSLCSAIRVHGLRAYVGPCGTSNAAGIVIYWVPVLRVQAVGTGTESVNVTGPGMGTVVGRVLHTLSK
jgi:hypothetical protein